MIYAHIYNGRQLFARANNAIEARRIFVRSIRSQLSESIDKAKNEIDAMLITYAIKSFRIAQDTVFEYCENWEAGIIGNAECYKASVGKVDDRPDSFINLRAYQKPSKKDWSYIPSKRETVHITLT